MNTYTIHLPREYPRQEALLRYLKKTISEYDEFLFEQSDQRGIPKCMRGKTHPDLVMTDVATGRQIGVDCRHIDEAIEKFESGFPSDDNQN